MRRQSVLKKRERRRIPESVILQKLQERFDLTRQKAEEYLKADDSMGRIP